MTEYGIIFDTKHFAVHDGPGIRTTIFLKGCPLHCSWCHNPEGISPKWELALLERKCEYCGECLKACPQGVHTIEDGEHRLDRSKCIRCGACIEACFPGALVGYGRKLTVDDCMEQILADRAFYETSGGGATFSGGEPLLQADFVAEVMKRLRAEGIDTALDTCASVDWSEFEKVLPYTSRVLFDIKHADARAHREHTGRSNEKIWDNLQRLGRTGIPIEIRIPCIPGINTEDETVDEIGRRLAQIPHIVGVRPLAYHDFARSKYKALGLCDTMPRVELPSAEMMDSIRERIAAFGLTIYK